MTDLKKDDAYDNTRAQPPIMVGKPIPPTWQVNLKNWDLPPFNRWSFNHVNEIIPSAFIARDEKQALFFPVKDGGLAPLTFTNRHGKKTSLQDYLRHGFVDALVVYHRGHIVFEDYFAFTTGQTRHLLQSMTKSVIGAVAQKLKEEKLLKADSLVESLLPSMKDSAYAGVTVQQALDMRSGVAYVEDYTPPMSPDCQAFEVANGWKPAEDNNPATKDNYSFLQSRRQRKNPPGKEMVYSSTDTDIVTHCLEAVAGKPIADLISQFFWQPMGAEASAAITVDSAGFGLGCGGMSARARDMLKFGVMMAEEGAVNGKQLLSPAMVHDCYNPAPYIFDKKHPELLPCGGYKNFFWIKDTTPQVILCTGVFGQTLIMDKTHNMVMVQYSTQPTYYNEDNWYDVGLLAEAIAKHLS